LPGELKKAQAQLFVARTQRLAAFERAARQRRCATWPNAVRMAADNPGLVQVRLLQQLDGSAGHTVVIGTLCRRRAGLWAGTIAWPLRPADDPCEHGGAEHHCHGTASCQAAPVRPDERGEMWNDPVSNPTPS
jgi:hypothetical protein